MVTAVNASDVAREVLSDDTAPLAASGAAREVLTDYVAPLRAAQLAREILGADVAPLRVASLVREVLIPTHLDASATGSLGGPIVLSAMTGGAVGEETGIVASGPMGGPIVITPMLATARGVQVVAPAPHECPPAAPAFPFGQTLLLDLAHWDVTVDIDGNIAIASLPYSAVQDACSAIRTFLGELWFDTTQGVPYLNLILGQAPNLSFLKLQFARAALTVPSVLEATAFITGVTNRALTGQVQLVLADGATATIGFSSTTGRKPEAFIVGHSVLSGGDVS